MGGEIRIFLLRFGKMRRIVQVLPTPYFRYGDLIRVIQAVPRFRNKIGRVRIEARVGVQVGFGQYALEKVVPDLTSRSRFGVRISGLKAPMVFQCCWSLVINRIFGLFICYSTSSCKP
jgi:hypothetical protein